MFDENLNEPVAIWQSKPALRYCFAGNTSAIDGIPEKLKAVMQVFGYVMLSPKLKK